MDDPFNDCIRLIVCISVSKSLPSNPSRDKELFWLSNVFHPANMTFIHFCLHCTNFFSTGSTARSSKLSSFLLRSKKLCPGCVSPCFNILASQTYKNDGITKILYNFNRDCFRTKSGF